MKRFLSTCLCLLLCISMTAGFLPARAAGNAIPITEEYFPDPVFRRYLDTDANGEHPDANRDGWLNADERNNIVTLFLDKTDQRPDYIRDMTGIAYFPNLRVLSVRGQALYYANLKENPNLIMLDVSNNLLRGLDLSDCVHLKTVYCQNNQISNLVLGNQPQLELLYCSGNELTDLALDGCANLQWLEMEQNYLREIVLPHMPNKMLIAPCFQKTGVPVTVYTQSTAWAFFIAHNPTNGNDVNQDLYYDTYDVAIDPKEGSIEYAEPDGMPLLVLNPGVTSAWVYLNHTVNGESHPASFNYKLLSKAPEITYTWVEGYPAACTENGRMDHYVGSDGLKYIQDSDGNMVAVHEDYLVIPATGHDWMPATYSWSEDYAWCTANRKCRNEAWGAHEEEQRVRTQALVTSYPSDTYAGETMYTAEFDEPWAQTQQIKVPGTPSGNHTITLAYDSGMGVAAVSQKSASEGQRIDFYAVPFDGYQVNRLIIASPMGEIPYHSYGDGEYFFIAPACECLINVEFSEFVPQFVDVSPKSYYYDAVNWAVRRKITSGLDDTHFGPNESCTRAQAVCFIWAASGSPEPSSLKNPFVDVSMNSYYAKAVLWAVEKGITTGLGNGRFGPDEPCTRSQIVSFLHSGVGKPTVEETLPFVDVPEKAFYAPAVKWAVHYEVTSGVTPTAFRPYEICSRAQIVLFLAKADRIGS